MAKKKWTVMVYLAGDNDLSEDMISSLKGIREVMKNEPEDNQINVVAFYDSNYPTVGLQYYEFSHDNIHNNNGTLKDLSKIKGPPDEGMLSRNRNGNISDEASIYRFINHVKKEPKFEADNYALIMAGHSDAVLGKVMFRDESTDYKITLKGLNEDIFKQSKNQLNIRDEDKLFSVLAFDSCMMGMLEVGYEFREIADYLVSSQGYSPTQGWSYFDILRELIEKKGDMNPEEFAQSIVKNQIKYSYDYSAGGRSMCLSSVNLSNVESFAKTFERLAKKLYQVCDGYNIDDDENGDFVILLADCLRRVLWESHYESQTFLHEQAVDILDFVNNLSNSCRFKLGELLSITNPEHQTDRQREFGKMLGTVSRLCGDVRREFNNYCKTDSSFYHGSDYQFSNGASVFFPWSLLSFRMIELSYKELEFSKKHKYWFEFIKLLNEITLRYRGEGGDLIFDTSNNFVDFVGSDLAARADTARADTARADTARADTARADTARGEAGERAFYRMFRRFRNHPIFHEVTNLPEEDQNIESAPIE